MHDNLFDHVNVKPENTHLPDGTKEDSDEECARYEELIRTLGGQDLQLLGLGHNGHIGFNEPDAIFEKATHCVDLQESTIEANKRFYALRMMCRDRLTQWESERSCRQRRS